MTPLQQLQGLLPSLVPEERRGRPGAAREAALAAAAAHPGERAAYLLVAVYASLAAGEPREALRLLDGVRAQDDAIARRIRACRAWAQRLERNWYPGETGAEAPAGLLEKMNRAEEAAAGDAETMLLASCVADGPCALLSARSIVHGLMLTSPAGAQAIAGSALQDLVRYAEVAENAGAVSSVLWAQAASTDIARRIGRLAEAREALVPIRAAYEHFGDAVGLAATWLLEGDWHATPGSSPEALGLRLDGEAAPPFADQRNDAAAAQAYAQAQARLGDVDAPRFRGALALRHALMASRAGDFEVQRKNLDTARAAFADAGDAAGEHLATVHGWLAALAGGEFAAVRAIAPLELGPLQGPVKEMVEWAMSRGSPSYGAGLGRILHRSGQRWVDEGRFDCAELAYRLARGLITLNDAVPAWTISDALAQLDDMRGFPSRSLVRRLQILDQLPVPRSTAQDAPAWLQDIYFTISLLSVPTGVTGIGLIAIRLIERAEQRLHRLLDLAGLPLPSDTQSLADPEAALRAADTSARADPATYLQQLGAGKTTAYERAILLQAATAVHKSVAGARPLASLVRARMAERLGLDAQAEFWFRTAVDQSRHAPEDGRWVEVLALSAWGKRAEALAAFRAVLDARRVGANLLPQLALRAGDYSRALDLLTTLPPPSDAAPGRAWRLLGDRAEATLESGDPASALGLAERGIDDFERWLAELTRDSDRLDACDDINATSLYQLAVRARLHCAETAEAAGAVGDAGEHCHLAFGIADRHRTLNLPVELATSELGMRTPAVRRWQQASTEQTTAYQRLLAALTLGTDTDANAEIPLAQTLAQAEHALANLEVDFTPAERAAVRQERQPRTLPAHEVQALLQPNVCLLEYQIVGRDLVAFAVTSSTVQSYETRLSYRLEGVASRLLRACAGGTQATAEASDLSRALLEPFAKHIDSSARVIVVPSSALNAVPFHVLPFRGDALGATRIVSYLPAAALLTRCGVDRPLAQGSTLVIGDPAFDPAAHPTLRRLAGAALEAQVIAKMLNCKMVFADETAREADLRPALPGHALLHIAAHGRLDDIAPNTSSIVLAGRDELTVSDLIGMNLDADLAVLSACDTGRGTTTLGGDLVGLARGLLAAGVKRCVVSLWPVDDVAACVTMVAFHTRLKGGAAPAEALAMAQREVRVLGAGEIAARYQAMGGVLQPGQRSRRRGAVGRSRQLSAFPETDLDDAASAVEEQTGSSAMIWAPFVLMGC